MPRAIVIGAGFGGLAAALRLRAAGLQVDVFDNQSTAGGRAGVYREQGYTFDAGPTVITAPFLFDELFALFDRRRSDYIQFQPLMPWYRIRFADGRTFDYGGTREQLIEAVRQFAPADTDGYVRLLKKVEQIYRVGFEQLGDQPFDDVGAMLRVLPQMAMLRSDRSVYEFVSGYLTDESLRRVFSFQPLLVGGNPFHTTSIYSLIQHLERKDGVHFAMGGTTALVAALVRLAEEAGIRFHMGQRVTEVLIEDGKARGIRLQDGRQEYAGCVVANADAPALYKQLVPARWRKRWTDRRIETRKFSMGLFVMYLGVRRQYPDVAHHTILLGERYKELLKDIFDDKILAEDLSLYLHAPTRTDPSLAPPGCESLYVLAPVPNLQAGIDWERERPRLEEHILDMLETTVCPGLRESLEVRFSVTPEHFRDNLLTHHGTGFSIQPTLLQSAWFRFHNRSEDVEGLYLVGAGTHPGAGLPGVLCSAKVLEHYIPEILSRDRNEPESSMVESQISPQGQEVTQ
jgi:phytoene desaturase